LKRKDAEIARLKREKDGEVSELRERLSSVEKAIAGRESESVPLASAR